MSKEVCNKAVVDAPRVPEQSEWTLRGFVVFSFWFFGTVSCAYVLLDAGLGLLGFNSMRFPLWNLIGGLTALTMLGRERKRAGGIRPWNWKEIKEVSTWAAVGLILGLRLCLAWFSGGVSLEPIRLNVIFPHGLWIAALIGPGILIPVAEEWLLRGILLPVLAKRWGLAASVIVTAILFGTLHLPDQFLAPFLHGLMLGYAAGRRQTLTVPILAHSLYNLVASVT